MKKITNKQYAEWREYKDAKSDGRLITPDGLRAICASLNNDPEAIGLHLLTCLHRFEQEDKTPRLKL